MAQLDRFLAALVSHRASALMLGSDVPAQLDMHGTPRAITKTAFNEQQLLGLLQELAPGNARMALDAGAATTFAYTSEDGAFDVQVTARADGLRAVARVQGSAAKVEEASVAQSATGSVIERRRRCCFRRRWWIAGARFGVEREREGGAHRGGSTRTERGARSHGGDAPSHGAARIVRLALARRRAADRARRRRDGPHSRHRGAAGQRARNARQVDHARAQPRRVRQLERHGLRARHSGHGPLPLQRDARAQGSAAALPHHPGESRQRGAARHLRRGAEALLPHARTRARHGPDRLRASRRRSAHSSI